MIRRLFACAMLLLTSAAVFAAPDTGDLFDLCPPDEGMRLVVESLDEDAGRGDLTEEQIRNAAESRLRAAGIYDPEADPYLYISVTVGPPENGSGRFPFYAIEVKYKRMLPDLRLSWLRFATTWDSGSAGQGGSSYILSNLSQHLDRFLVDYLRVRDSEACQALRTEAGTGLNEERRTFDFSTLPHDQE